MNGLIESIADSAAKHRLEPAEYACAELGTCAPMAGMTTIIHSFIVNYAKGRNRRTGWDVASPGLRLTPDAPSDYASILEAWEGRQCIMYWWELLRGRS
jgi:hypothetical protein